MLYVELVGSERLNIGKRPSAEIVRNYHNYLLEDMSDLFYEYRGKEIFKADADEIHRRIEYLETSYHAIVGRTFGIMFNTHGNKLNITLYPL